MITFPAKVSCGVGFVLLVAGSFAATADDRVPDGLSASDWSGIRALHKSNRHAVVAVDGGYLARNASQQWQTRFDGRGFETRPQVSSQYGGSSEWSWGLELISYGRGDAQRLVAAPTCVAARDGRVEYIWDETVSEWYLNDTRGLEHGYTLHQRPGHGKWPTQNSTPATADDVELLQLTLAVRGGLRPVISDNGRDVAFVNASGAAVVNYNGLKVFDANGVELPAWFEATAGGLCLSVADGGAPYPLTIDPVAQQAYLKASNTGANDEFGYDVAISGNTVVVGAQREDSNATGVNGDQTNNAATDSGAAYVFVRDANGVWSQQAYLKASNTGTDDLFGRHVAVSGDTVVVGAASEDSNARGVNGDQHNNSATAAGAAYVFVRDANGVWSQQAYLKASNTDAQDVFGSDVSISGDTVVVSAIGESSNSTGVNGDQNNNSALLAGALYVFVRDANGVWSQQAYIKASNTELDDRLGTSVFISSDTILAGAYLEDSNATGVNGDQTNNSASSSGAAYVFVRDANGVWSQQAYLKASNTETGDLFGFDLGLSGDTAVIGAFREDSNATGINGDQSDNSATDSGAAYVFVRTGSVWSQQAYLKASRVWTLDNFGAPVAVSGDIVVVGMPGEDSGAFAEEPNNNSAPSTGAAFVFVRSGHQWFQDSYVKASNLQFTDSFGWSVAVSGNTMAIGAIGEDSSATGVNGDQFNNSALSAGAAYIITTALDTDNDGVPDSLDICPDNAEGLAVDCHGRPSFDANGDCLVDGADIQIIVQALMNQ